MEDSVFVEWVEGLSEINAKRCCAFLCIIAFCRANDLNPWEIIMCYFQQLLDV
jgi:hypothetical protein